MQTIGKIGHYRRLQANYSTCTIGDTIDEVNTTMLLLSSLNSPLSNMHVEYVELNTFYEIIGD